MPAWLYWVCGGLAAVAILLVVAATILRYAFREMEQMRLVIKKLLEAETLEGKKHVIETNPVLLTPAAFIYLDNRIAAARSEPNEEFAKYLLDLRGLMYRCYEVGIERAFAERDVWDGVRATGIPVDSLEDFQRVVATHPDIQSKMIKAAHETAAAQSDKELELETIAVELGQASTLTDSARCIPLCKRALELMERERNPLAWAGFQSLLGSHLMGYPSGNLSQNLEDAIQAFQQALSVYTRQDYPDRWAMIMLKMGFVYSTRVEGDPGENIEKSIEAYEKAFEYITGQNNPDEWSVGTTVMALGYLTRLRGDRGENLERAIAYFQRALQRLDPRTSPDLWSETMHNLAVAYFERLQGDPAENAALSIQVCQEALKVQTREAMPVQWAETIAEMANAYAKRAALGEPELFDNAIQAYEQALQVLTRQSAPQAWATTMNNLGKTYSLRSAGDRAENVERAIEALNQTLYVRTPHNVPSEWAQTQLNLGHAYCLRLVGSREENTARAVKAYQQSLEVYRPDTMPHECRWAAYSLGNLLFDGRRWQEAVDAYQQALQATEILYQASLLRTSKQAELAQITDLYHRAAYASACAGDLQDAVVILEQSRARGLRETLARDRTDLEQVKKHDPEAYQLYVQAAARLGQLEAQERTDGYASASKQWSAAIEAMRSQVKQALSDLHLAVERIRRIAGHERFLAPTDWSDIREAIQPGAPLVYLVTAPTGSLGLVVCLDTQTKEPIIESARANEFTTELLDILLLQPGGQSILRQDSMSGRWFILAEREVVSALLTLLGERLIGPMAACLQAARSTSVILIPVGRLSLLPLHAAQYHTGERQVHLLDEFDVTYAPSAQVLSMARRALAARETAPRRLTGIGNPMDNPVPLRYACAELEQVATFFAPDASHPLCEHDATKTALMADLPGATYIHLSCHGVFDLDEPLNSHLQLANGETLALREILEFEHLKYARLAVLSACQTAITDFNKLPDEAIGLPAGFFQAGVPGVVGTLWPVNDLSTMLLMVRFYEFHLQGDPATGEGPVPPARALCRAQLWLRDVTNAELGERFEVYKQTAPDAPDSSRMPYAFAREMFVEHTLRDPNERPFAHPYYWAAFAFYGV
jgi:CHAT domain-containing protein/tetratricopeptide (TPR) repeat protein